VCHVPAAHDCNDDWQDGSPRGHDNTFRLSEGQRHADVSAGTIKLVEARRSPAIAIFFEAFACASDAPLAFLIQQIAALDDLAIRWPADRLRRDARHAGPNRSIVRAVADLFALAEEASAGARIGAHGFVFLDALALFVANAVTRTEIGPCLGNCHAVLLRNHAGTAHDAFAVALRWLEFDIVRAISLVQAANLDETNRIGLSQSVTGRKIAGTGTDAAAERGCGRDGREADQ
jgi:hypothetical protein